MEEEIQVREAVAYVERLSVKVMETTAVVHFIFYM